jgi:hypothetical protein
MSNRTKKTRKNTGKTSPTDTIVPDAGRVKKPTAEDAAAAKVKDALKQRQKNMENESQEW